MDPKTLHYAPTHEWVHVEGDIATIGISKFAVDQLTDLIVIELPKIGSKVKSGKSFGEVESVKAVSDLYSPVGGEVVDVNAAVAADVQILAEDPYVKGWLIKVKLDNQADVAGLLSFADYSAKVADEAH